MPSTDEKGEDKDDDDDDEDAEEEDDENDPTIEGPYSDPIFRNLRLAGSVANNLHMFSHETVCARYKPQPPNPELL